MRLQTAGALTCALLAGTLLTVGCETTPPMAPERHAAIVSMEDTSDALKSAGLQVMAMNSDLERATSTTDLPMWIKDFQKSLDKLQGSSDRAKKRWWDLREDTQQYTVAWDRDITEVSDQQVKESMEQRRSRISAAFDRLVGESKDVFDSYGPYLADLNNINTALKMDPTASGVAALKPTIDKAKNDGQTVMSKLDKFQRDVDKLRGRLTTTMPTTHAAADPTTMP